MSLTENDLEKLEHTFGRREADKPFSGGKLVGYFINILPVMIVFFGAVFGFYTSTREDILKINMEIAAIKEHRGNRGKKVFKLQNSIDTLNVNLEKVSDDLSIYISTQMSQTLMAAEKMKEIKAEHDKIMGKR